MYIVDSHCHLDMLMKHYSLEQILSKATNAGVKYLQTISINLNNMEQILSIAKKSDKIFASIGIHPNEVSKSYISDDITLNTILKFASNSKITSIGETGLDYYNISIVPKIKNIQQQSLITHIRAAQKTSLPVIIHTRNAEPDTKKILLNLEREQHFSGVLHCFTGSKEFAKSMLDIGMYISMSGIITFKNAQNLNELLNYIPLDRLLCETDSPYLSPEPKRGKINDPSNCRHILTHISKTLKIEFEKLCELTTRNFFNLFKRAKR